MLLLHDDRILILLCLYNYTAPVSVTLPFSAEAHEGGGTVEVCASLVLEGEAITTEIIQVSLTTFEDTGIRLPYMSIYF